jgi:hypothetical protein
MLMITEKPGIGRTITQPVKAHQVIAFKVGFKCAVDQHPFYLCPKRAFAIGTTRYLQFQRKRPLFLFIKGFAAKIRYQLNREHQTKI